MENDEYRCWSGLLQLNLYEDDFLPDFLLIKRKWGEVVVYKVKNVLLHRDE